MEAGASLQSKELSVLIEGLKVEVSALKTKEDKDKKSHELEVRMPIVGFCYTVFDVV